jgi:hypothetical protein
MSVVYYGSYDAVDGRFCKVNYVIDFARTFSFLSSHAARILKTYIVLVCPVSNLTVL